MSLVNIQEIMLSYFLMAAPEANDQLNINWPPIEPYEPPIFVSEMVWGLIKGGFPPKTLYANS